MKINMFEGARRITKLIAVIWVMGWCIYLFTFNPTIYAYFRVDSPGSTPIRMGEQESGCDAYDANEIRYSQHTSKGTDFKLEFCFKPSNDGSKLIPVARNVEQLAEWVVVNRDKKGSPEFESVASAYQAMKADNKIKTSLWGYEKYSSEVSSYTEKVADGFKLFKADEDWIDGEVWPSRWKNIKEGSLWIIGGVACLYIFSWCIGWIIRGFAGIPLGHDRKPDDM